MPGRSENFRQSHLSCAALSSDDDRKTHIALVGGFKPTKCGIATFTTDIYEQLTTRLPSLKIDVYAMVPSNTTLLASEATSAILKNDARSYAAAARRMNDDGVDMVWIQHEFGIYGGSAGNMVLELIEAVAAPVIVSLHTILREPNDEQRAVIAGFNAKVTKFIVMTEAGRDTLISVYGIERSRVHVVEHGAPDREQIHPSAARRSLGLPERPTIMTFGLLGPGKGLEAGIRALPAIVARNPDAVYRIVGATHPNLVSEQGESYRDGLKALARDLGVEASIDWVERFLEPDELINFLSSCDVYLTPYPNLAQSTSGTLAYAIALGCAVVSTPYEHAREILADGVGLFVPPNDPVAIADAINSLFLDQNCLLKFRSRAYARGRQTIWSHFATRCEKIIETVVNSSRVGSAVKTRRSAPAHDAFLAMVDDVGIFQHARGIVPDRNHGYCIDDNARALMLANMLGNEFSDYAIRFSAFVQHAWNPDLRRFRNFMGYDRRWLETTGSEDSNGRTLWAIAHTALHAHSPGLREWAKGLFNATAPHLSEMASPRAMAFVVLAAELMGSVDPRNSASGECIKRCVERFSRMDLIGTKMVGDETWRWPEPSLAYDNARIPQALFALAKLASRADFGEAALLQLDWLCDIQTTATGHFRPVGCASFGKRHRIMPFDQQPLEAWAMIDACAAAMTSAPSERWLGMARMIYLWYLGRNDRGVAIADAETGLCYDGLTPLGVNSNSGAESIVSFLLAHQTLLKISGGHAGYEREGKSERRFNHVGDGQRLDAR